MRAPIALAVVVAGFSVLITAALASSNTFDGSPPAPLAYPSVSGLSTWDVQVHERGQRTYGDAVPQMSAQHGADCAGPPATHTTDGTRAAAVFQCRDHIMTAMNGPEYGVIYLMPPEMVDFSSGSGVIEWEMSTERMSVRDWPDITISPLMDSQALPLVSDLSQGVDLQGANRNGVTITMDNAEGAPNLKVATNGDVNSYGPPGWAGHSLGEGIAAGTNQAAVRQPMRVTISTNRVRFERLPSATGPGVVYFDTAIAPLAWTRAVVQFGHHSYTPTKDNAGVPATWHWDSFSITPSVPFYLDARRGFLSSTGTVTTNPAPADAYLRFAAVCRVSVDGVFATKMVDGGNPINASSYLVPVAQGSTQHTIGFAADSWYGTNLGCMAKDFSVVSGGAPSQPTSTATPGTVTPTPTASPSPTASPTPLATPTPSASPTPSPVYRCQVRNANGSYSTVWTKAGGGACP